MKSFSKFSILLLLAAISILSCGKLEDSDNEITDPEGVLIELTWSNSATNPVIGTDLELIVRQNLKSLMQSASFGSFEKLVITPGLLNDGTYNLDVFVDTIDRVTNYKITVTGKSTAKTHTRSFGPINANDTRSTLKPLSLTIAGNRFSVI
jgi:hypothetical protein